MDIGLKTVIKSAKLKGRGVYARDFFQKGELIEKSELILLNLNEVQSDLEGYIYQYTKKNAALALGRSFTLTIKKNIC